MVAARGEPVSEERRWRDLEKTGEIYQRYVGGLSQPTPGTCTLDALRSLSTPPSTTNNEHHLRTCFRITRSSTHSPVREASIQSFTDVKRCQMFLFEMEVETDRYREISGGASAYDYPVFLARHGFPTKARRTIVRPSVFVGRHRCRPPRQAESGA